MKILFKIKFPSECKLVKGNDSIESFYISAFPITNHEYITYMGGLKRYYVDYQEEWVRSWPVFGKIDGETYYYNY